MNKEKTPESPESGEKKSVEESHKGVARAVWTAISSKQGKATSWDIYQKVKRQYSGINLNQVRYILNKYCNVSGKRGNKNFYSWNKDYEVPEPPMPEDPPEYMQFGSKEKPKINPQPPGPIFSSADAVDRWQKMKDEKEEDN